MLQPFTMAKRFPVTNLQTTKEPPRSLGHAAKPRTGSRGDLRLIFRPSMPAREHKKKFRIVVAEKDTKRRTAVCGLVEQLHGVPVAVESVPEILKAIQGRRVDLVLLDVDLVWLEESDTVETIRQLAPLVPIVMMSHRISPSLTRRLCDRGIQSFIVKPVQRDLLAMTLFRYLL